MLPAFLYWFIKSPEIPFDWQGHFADCQVVAKNHHGPVPDQTGCLAAVSNHVFAMDYGSIGHLYNWSEIDKWDVDKKNSVWLGTLKEFDPEMVRRERVIGGYSVKLGDGKMWLIPVANPMVESCSLPYGDVYKFGEWSKEINQEYYEISQKSLVLAGKLREALLLHDFEAKEEQPVQIEVPDSELRDIIYTVIQLNYKITLEELSSLHVFSPECYWPVVHAIIDWTEMLELLRKRMIEVKGSPPINPSEATDDTSNIGRGGTDT